MRLESVLTWGIRGVLFVDMEYIGGVLSVNRYKTATGRTRHDVKKWMDELAWAVRQAVTDNNSKLEPPISVSIEGFFVNHNHEPDLANLHKVIGDALEDGLGINDKHFRFHDGEPTIVPKRPWLRITIK